MQPFPIEIRMFYYLELGMYVSLLYSVSQDHKRKDFWEVGHHCLCIAVLTVW
jgi:hypothetical protein